MRNRQCGLALAAAVAMLGLSGCAVDAVAAAGAQGAATQQDAKVAQQEVAQAKLAGLAP